VVGLVGENGAKSTLMKILGVYQPDGGELRVEGKPVVIQNVTMRCDSVSRLSIRS
jgi:ABC-type sugar transport system ATPase subunit